MRNISILDIKDFARNVDASKDIRKKLVSTFQTVYDREIVAIISSWLYNGNLSEDYVLESTIEKMLPNPITYIMQPANETQCDNGSYCGMMTNANYINLINKIRDVNIANGGMLKCYNSYIYTKKHKCKYAHEALAYMFGGGTGFPTKASKSTFFRYNYLFYLIYTMKIWDDGDFDVNKALLPCNDKIMLNAYKYGITKNVLRSDFRGAVELSTIARQMFGEKDFYFLFDFLNFASDDG